MKKHVLISIILLCYSVFLFSQKNEKPDRWVKNTIGLIYEDKIDGVYWEISGHTSNTDSFKGIDFQMIRFSYAQFFKSGNFQEFEISKFNIGIKTRKVVYMDLTTLVSAPINYSKNFSFEIAPKWQYNWGLSRIKTKNKFFVGVGIQPFYEYERRKPVRHNTFPHHIRKDKKYGTSFFIAPRIFIINNKKILIDLSLSKSFYKYQKIIYTEDHDHPNRKKKFTYSDSTIIPVDFELNFGIGIKLNSK